MRSRNIVLIVVLFLASLVSSCGGSSSTAASGGGSLEGNWYGILGTLNGETSTFNTPAVTIGLTVNANNTANNAVVNGINTGVTYTIAAVPNQTRIYSVTGSDGSSGGFLVDSSYTHLVYLSSAGVFSVMQKGASSLPTYSSSDPVGSWSGFSLEMDSSFNIIDTYASSATVASNGSFNGANKYGAYTGQFNAISTTTGRVVGSLTSTTPTNVQAWISADKTFAGGFACAGSVSISTCSYSAWNK